MQWNHQEIILCSHKGSTDRGGSHRFNRIIFLPGHILLKIQGWGVEGCWSKMKNSCKNGLALAGDKEREVKKAEASSTKGNSKILHFSIFIST